MRRAFGRYLQSHAPTSPILGWQVARGNPDGHEARACPLHGLMQYVVQLVFRANGPGVLQADGVGEPRIVPPVEADVGQRFAT